MTEKTEHKIIQKNLIQKTQISNDKTTVDYQNLLNNGNEILQVLSKKKKGVLQSTFQNLHDPLANFKVWSILRKRQWC